ncbi:hypothetical protein Bbelb_291860 [Branchiostoma belcheri]|nr:hypothetical protein Bbelb_291860 [Branchiostoma belcheri]
MSEVMSVMAVRQYLIEVKAEQANAMIQHTQTQPVFVEKLTAVCKHIAEKIKTPDVRESTLFTLAREQAFLKIMLLPLTGPLTWDVVLKSEELAWLPNEEGVIQPHFREDSTGRDGKRVPHPGAQYRGANTQRLSAKIFILSALPCLELKPDS